MRKCVLILLLLSVVVFTANAAEKILRLHLDGSINPVTRELVLRVLRQAEKTSAELVLIELNTPGGLDQSTRDIVSAELNSAVPVVVFVSPSGARAASAGTFITMAADVAAMAPGTNIGAAHPVSLLGGSGEEGAEDTSMDKAANDAAAFARSIAEQRGRSITWAESAVLESSSISASEALAENVIDLIAEDTDELLDRLHGYELADGRVLETFFKQIVEIRPNLRERLLSLLADPNLVYVLFILGIYGLIYEFFQPGIGFGLAAGGICLLLALFGLQVLPVNIAGVALILFGIGLFVLDAFTPTNGILSLGGVVALFAGSLTLFDIADRSVGLSLGTILATVGGITLFSIFVLSKGIAIQRRAPATGVSQLIGAECIVRRDLNPIGTVFLHGEYWTARSAHGMIREGEHAIVEAMGERRQLLVRRIDDKPSGN